MQIHMEVKMKRFLSFLVVFVLAFTASAHATQRTATFGDKNASGVYRLRADTDQSAGTNYGWITFAQDTGIKYPYQSFATTIGAVSIAHQFVTADSGTVLTDYGGIAASTTTPVTIGYGSIHRLPPCNSSGLGLRYTVAVGSRAFVTLDTYDLTDVILYSISGAGLSAGDSVKSTGQAGDEVSVQCNAANTWTVVDMKGAWTDNN